MPGLTGMDVAREVAAARADLPVVITSGYSSDELLAQAAGAGVRALLQKQHMLEQLTRVVREQLPA
jgi:DNA-binding NarL/FixJ family response regulator